LLGSRLVSEAGTVHAFEPQQDLFKMLEINAARNQVTNLISNHCAVADAEGECEFLVRDELAASSISQPNSPEPGNSLAHTVRVRTLSLDRYCLDHTIRPDLIKVDVEGAEILVLEGARGLLSLDPSLAPVWILEFSPQTFGRFGNRWEDLMGILTFYGYRLFEIRSDSSLEPMDRPDGEQTLNLVAMKRMID
jgi:FkbM family methyltransferase